jgi:hypothetical protein
LQANAPLWAILLTLALLQIVALQLRKNQASNSPKYESLLIKHNDLKWLVTTKDGKFSHISDAPYCPIHDSKMVSNKNYYFCNETIGSNCKTKFIDHETASFLRHIASSYSESKINSYKTLHE